MNMETMSASNEASRVNEAPAQGDAKVESHQGPENAVSSIQKKFVSPNDAGDMPSER